MLPAEGKQQAPLTEIAGIPVDLYRSIQGKFFVGLAENLRFGGGTSAWAGLANPTDSGVNLFVWVWAITDVLETAYRVQIWMNAVMPGVPQISHNVSPANTAIQPIPIPRVRLEYASMVQGDPIGGVKAFVRRGQPGVAIYSVEDGKFICPPGGSFSILLSDPETPGVLASGKIFYQWWEEEA